MGWFGRWTRGNRDEPMAEEPSGPIDDARDQLRESARERIVPGFAARGDVAEMLAEYHDDLDLPESTLEALAREVVEQEWAARLAEQAAWTDPGDYSRVQAAFDDLAANGILARMNFTCCQTCGNAEIFDQCTPLPAEEVTADTAHPYREWGYTFFHEQDAERLASEPADLYLSYGWFLPAPGVDAGLVERADAGDEEAGDDVGRESSLAVGRLVVAALTRQGLSVTWPEKTSWRIAVTGLRWRKPLP